MSSYLQQPAHPRSTSPTRSDCAPVRADDGVEIDDGEYESALPALIAWLGIVLIGALTAVVAACLAA